MLANIYFVDVYTKFIGIVPRCRSLNFVSVLLYILLMDIYPHLTLERCKRLFAGAVVITVICAQYTTLLMAQPEVNAPCQPKAPSVHWNEDDIATLIDYLYEHHSQAEGGGNFKQQVLENAAVFINTHKPLQAKQSGALKTAKAVQSKWTLLKATFNSIEKYCNQTGVHWDNETGAGIKGSVADAVNQPMHSFHNKGWEHYKKMQAIIPLGGARGQDAFCPGSAIPSITNLDTDLVDAAPQAAVPTATAAGPSSACAGPSSAAAITTSITSSTAAHSTAAHSTAMSTAAGSNASKRLYSDVMGDIETMSFGSTHMSSMQPPSTTLVSSPLSKKPQTPVVSQNSHITKISSATKAVKITLAAAVVGMQGTINWLTDVFEWFVRGGPDGKDSDLPLGQQAALITTIGSKGNKHYLKFYMNMQEKCMRHAFVVKLIGEEVDAGDAGPVHADAEMMG
ncbi:uncharacterized protein BJ212DRAFT_1297943 [Suillus subaureus]|uniref:Myb/SANT-like domain-containing protein n=1 Tax=Suillus subaureus TaxID=48587 RepID=A0A9P7JG55_9AGAM|nr:uncharacterized protein BJ212DRAFT_1297943 [Suillus subaureus]KAG1820577.1 hypothetical protein BJ212DRAFT_1297943 [Suillus subaureus]